MEDFGYELPDLKKVEEKPEEGEYFLSHEQFYVPGKGGEMPQIDYNCPRTFNPEVDLRALAERTWDHLTWPTGFERFTEHLEAQKLLHCGGRGDHYA